MTRKEKEKILLDGLGLKVGDVVEITYNKEKNEIEQFEIKEYMNKHYLLHRNNIEVSIGELILFDFTKIVPKKKKGNLICNECVCDKCPLLPLKCNMVAYGDTLYDGLDKIKEYLDLRVYEAYKQVLDDEVEE